eukprot:TRINITY_DN99478_c0_g1_i1.p1 TRINITY_DN99478_c0_g1~~TRINITY_DN99478_c0_g1_i1.p1  ORF type:complete len:178 (+),score=36.63 TRINITY_DN99478_c0_g1_i1:3-536(+)
MIFEPADPVPIFGGRVVLQGLFLKRQEEVSAEYARIVAEHLLSAKYLIPAILTGSCADALFQMVHKHVDLSYHKNFGTGTKTMLSLFRGSEQISRYKRLVGEKLVSSMSDTMRHVEKYLDEAMDLESVLSERMAAMRPSDFEQLLHPVFQEDEWKLVLLGGLLGVAIGMLQWHFLGS